VVLIKGALYDAKTKNPIDGFIEYHEFNEAIVKAKGKEHSDPSSGKYTVIFPYGEKFAISAHSDAHVASYDTISFEENGSEYQEIIRDFYLTPIIKGEKVVLNHVNFETNSAVFELTSFHELNKVAEFLLQNEEVEIMIGGHTDNAGTPEHNKKLSDARAKAVMDYLLSKGISENRVSAKGFGEDQPVAPNDNPENMRKNRRVEFTIIKE
jgi:OmpA-OmpF porin, OOP family